jgi:hypothetical protein
MAAPLGFSLGLCGEKWGGYAGMKINISPKLNDISEIIKKSSNSISWNEKEYNRFAITAGIMRRLWNWCYLYGGIGYGTYQIGYLLSGSSSPQKYYALPSAKMRGMETEIGATIIFWDCLSFSMGYNTLLFSGGKGRFSDVHIGIGLGLTTK